MNKLLTKIASLSVGFAMAIGIGIAAGGKAARRVEAAEKTDTINLALTGITGNSYTNWSGKTSLSDATYAGNSCKGKNAIQMRSSNSNSGIVSTASGGTIKSVSVTFVADTGNDGKVLNVYGSSTAYSAASDLYNNSTAGTRVKQFTYNSESPTQSYTFTSDYEYIGFRSESGAIYISEIQITWTEPEVKPTVTSVTVTVGNKVGSYKGDTYIQCSATVNGTNNPSQNVTWSLNTTNTYVATKIVEGASIDDTGKVWFEKDMTVYAFASSTVTGYTNIHGSATCTVSGLLDPVSYVKLDKTGRLQVGLKVVITSSDGTKIMTTTQNNNNRGSDDITSTTDLLGNITAPIIPTKHQVFELEAGNVAGSYSFGFMDGQTKKYIYAAGNSTNNYLRTTTYKSDAASFTIVITDSVATIKSCDSSMNPYMRYNSGNKVFACYASNEAQSACSIYMLGNALPDEVKLSTISNATVENVQIDDSVVLTASYTPINATETINISASVEGKVSFEGAEMSNGTYRVTITGLAVAENITLTLVGSETSSATTTTTISVTAYSKTHDLVTSSGSLFNGQKVIIGNKGEVAEKMYRLVATTHAGGNTNPAASVPFANDGSSLSNVSGNAVEFTIWNLTIKDSNEQDVTGWAFYDNGYFLTADKSTSSNLLKRTQKLSSLCLFNVTISTANNETTCSIVAADSGVARNKMFINVDSTIVNCYAAAIEDKTMPVQLYSNQTSSDANIAAGYERAFLKIGDISTDDKGTGKCSSYEYYSYAKSVYTNGLSVAQKALLSQAAKDRLEAWATANGDTFDASAGTFTPNQRVSLSDAIVNNNSLTLIIIIMSSVVVLGIGCYFFIKKKHRD